MKKFYFLLLTSILFLTVTKQVFSDEKNIFPKKKPILVPEIKEKKVRKGKVKVLVYFKLLSPSNISYFITKC